MTQKQKLIITIFISIFAIVLIVSSFMVWNQYRDRQEDIDNFSNLQNIIQDNASGIYGNAVTENESSGTVSEGDKYISPDGTVDEGAVHKRNLSELYAQNNDLFAWIYIEGTKVDYPVMHTPENPEKYLRRNFDAKYSYSGVPFMDGRCSADSDNYIIYGHNMKNGTMFSDIIDYEDKAFRDEYPIIELETNESCRFFTVFSAMYVDGKDKWYHFALYSFKPKIYGGYIYVYNRHGRTSAI